MSVSVASVSRFEHAISRPCQHQQKKSRDPLLKLVSRFEKAIAKRSCALSVRYRRPTLLSALRRSRASGVRDRYRSRALRTRYRGPTLLPPRPGIATTWVPRHVRSRAFGLRDRPWSRAVTKRVWWTHPPHCLPKSRELVGFSTWHSCSTKERYRCGLAVRMRNTASSNRPRETSVSLVGYRWYICAKHSPSGIFL